MGLSQFRDFEEGEPNGITYLDPYFLREEAADYAPLRQTRPRNNQHSPYHPNTIPMKTKSVLATALILAVSAPAALIAASADETAIRELTASFAVAWNNHDAAAMAATWAEDGDLINPAGVVAKGRAAVQKLLAHEHATVMKASTFEITGMDVRMMSPTIATGDWSIVVTGMVDSDGNVLPPRNMHVFQVYKKHDGKWLSVAGRPYSFSQLAPPKG